MYPPFTRLRILPRQLHRVPHRLAALYRPPAERLPSVRGTPTLDPSARIGDGGPTARTEYAAFGTELSRTGTAETRFGYQGTAWMRLSSGLYVSPTRLYLPTVGRFGQADVIAIVERLRGMSRYLLGAIRNQDLFAAATRRPYRAGRTSLRSPLDQPEGFAWRAHTFTYAAAAPPQSVDGDGRASKVVTWAAPYPSPVDMLSKTRADIGLLTGKGPTDGGYLWSLTVTSLATQSVFSAARNSCCCWVENVDIELGNTIYIATDMTPGSFNDTWWHEMQHEYDTHAEYTNKFNRTAVEVEIERVKYPKGTPLIVANAPSRATCRARCQQEMATYVTRKLDFIRELIEWAGDQFDKAEAKKQPGIRATTPLPPLPPQPVGGAGIERP